MINEVFRFGTPITLSLTCSNPTTPASGDPVRIGNSAGVAETDERADGTTTVNLGPAVVSLSCKGVIDGPSNNAIAVGDPLFYVDADTPKISKKVAGYFIGWALGTVGSGSTGTISVLVAPRPVGGSIGAGAVGTTELADANVTAAKLTATLATGFIPLDLTTARILATNAIQNTTEGGVPDGNTTPILARVNGATDIALRLTWAATVVTEIQWSVPKPPDLDAAADVTVHLMLAKDANDNSSAVVAVKFFDGVGDTNAGSNTAALDAAALAEYIVTVDKDDVAAAPGFFNVALVPGAHAADAVYCYAAWIEYTRA